MPSDAPDFSPVWTPALPAAGSQKSFLLSPDSPAHSASGCNTVHAAKESAEDSDKICRLCDTSFPPLLKPPSCDIPDCQNNDDLLISNIHRSPNRNRIRKSSIQIRDPIDIYNRTKQRHTGGCPADFHQPVGILRLIHVLRFSRHTVCRDQLTVHL